MQVPYRVLESRGLVSVAVVPVCGLLYTRLACCAHVWHACVGAGQVNSWELSCVGCCWLYHIAMLYHIAVGCIILLCERLSEELMLSRGTATVVVVLMMMMSAEEWRVPAAAAAALVVFLLLPLTAMMLCSVAWCSCS